MKKIKSILILTLTMIMMVSMFAPAVASASTIYRRLEYGDSGNDVKQLQTALKKLGYFNGNIGGNYLDLTQTAVKAYQKANGLKMTSYCTTKMQERIHEDSSKKANRTLHYGDSGDDVKALQRALKRLGYFNGNVGGNYLKQTRAAVRAFQEDYGYRQTNYCTVSMQKLIRQMGG